MIWWHGRQLPDPTKLSCSVLVVLWGPSADRTWAIPWIRQDDSPWQNTKPATARSAPRWRRADRQQGGELWSPIGGSPFSATNCQARKRTAQAASRTVSATCTSGSNSIATPIRAIMARAAGRTLERSNLNMSAYNRETQRIYPTISWYERSMSKKTLDMH